MNSVARKRVEIIVPFSNTIVESDFGPVGPPTISTHFARAFLAETSAAAEQVMIEKHVPQAVVDLGSARVVLITGTGLKDQSHWPEPSGASSESDQ